MAREPNALRLTFSYKDGVLQLVSKTKVEMVIPPGDPPVTAPERGFWAELRDASSKSLFRRVLHDPIPTDMEVFTDEPGKTVSRAPGGPTEGMFTVVVPNNPKATELALFSSRHEMAQPPAQPPQGLSPALPFHAVRAVPPRPGAAQEIVRFDLKKP